MKLLRYLVRKGKRNPACSTPRANSRSVRDRSRHCGRHAAAIVHRPPAAAETRHFAARASGSAAGRLCRARGQVPLCGSELFGPRGGIEHGRPRGTHSLHEGHLVINGPNDDVVIPRGSQKSDWEVELGVVIGAERNTSASPTRCRTWPATASSTISRSGPSSSKARAMGEGQERRYVRADWSMARHDRRSARLAEPRDLAGSRRHRYQHGSTKTMVFGVPFLVSYLSRFMSLQPGDVISTGTPPGVGLGQKPPVYLKAGNRMRLGIDGLGVQDQRVVG